MSYRWSILCAAGLALLAMAVVLGCEGDDPSGVIADASEDASNANEADAFEDRITFETGDDACSLRCSSDLRSIVDCATNEVTKTCPKTQACLAGDCVEPCRASDGNHSAVGCEYYASVPAAFPAQSGQCYAVALANTWPTDVTISVDYGSTILDPSSFGRLAWSTVDGGSLDSGIYGPLAAGKIPAGAVAILFLAAHGNQNGAHCPVDISPAITDHNIELPGTGLTTAFHIVSDYPLVAYDLYPYDGASVNSGSSSFLLSTGSWTTNYIAQTPYTASVVASPSESFVQIIAREDQTDVKIQASNTILGEPDAGIPACDKDDIQTYSLRRGQVLQFTQADELAGSVIASTKPIGVWGGMYGFTVGVTDFYADMAHQQVMPVNALGSRYPAVAHRDRVVGRAENPPWRVVGVVDDTRLSYSPNRPQNAPSTINRGDVVTFSFNLPNEASYPFVISSQDSDHPFYFWQYMTGGDKFLDRGDPEWVAVSSDQHYANYYLFSTDPSYPEVSLVVIRERIDGSFSDVTLDCTGAIMGWTAIDSSGEFQYARVNLVSGNFEPVNGCHNGTHTITSTNPFGFTLWGWGTIDNTFNSSYALSPSIGARHLNDVSVPIK